MSAQLTYDDLWQFPKANLHQHLDGSVRPDVVINLAERFMVKLPTYDLDEFKKLYTMSGLTPDTGLFERFAWPIAVMRTPEGLEEVAYQAVLDCSNENIRYAEFRFAPSYHSFWPPKWYARKLYEKRRRRVMEMDDVVRHAILGIRRGELETGITANLVLCIPRECKTDYPRLDLAMRIADLAIRFQHHGVVGIDLACDEFLYEPELYADEFQRIVGTNIRGTAHAGEMGSRKQRVSNIATCMDKLVVRRLGHAYDLPDEQHLTQSAYERGITIERHPLGAFAPPLAEQGIDMMLARGILVSICSDDPALYRQTLTQNLHAVLDHYSWGKQEFQKLTANALVGAFFATPLQQKRVLADFVAHGLDAMLEERRSFQSEKGGES